MSTLLEQLAALAELQKQATPGPWRWVDKKLESSEPYRKEFTAFGTRYTDEVVKGMRNMSNGDGKFVAAAGSLDFAALHAALSPAPVAAGGAGEELVELKKEIDAMVFANKVTGNAGIRTERIILALYDLAARPTTPAAAVAAEAGGWIPVSERLPPITRAHPKTGCHVSQLVLVAQDGKTLPDPHYMREPHSWYCGAFATPNITHWMPLPANPKRKRKGATHA